MSHPSVFLDAAGIEGAKALAEREAKWAGVSRRTICFHTCGKCTPNSTGYPHSHFAADYGSLQMRKYTIWSLAGQPNHKRSSMHPNFPSGWNPTWTHREIIKARPAKHCKQLPRRHCIQYAPGHHRLWLFTRITKIMSLRSNYSFDSLTRSLAASPGEAMTSSICIYKH